MVRKLGKGRMATMLRLLASGDCPKITEEVIHDKFAAQVIHKELHEANLLDEEDMHVFDCKPLADPLHLVCCNSCKKPVKVSQFAGHADRCRSLNSAEDNMLGLDGGTGNKKPPRKGRKKLQASYDNQATSIVEQERLECKDGNGTTVLDQNMNGPAGLYKEAKRTSVAPPRTLVMDGSGVNSTSISYYDGVVAASKRRTKLMTAEPLPLVNCPETRKVVATEIAISWQEALPYAPVPLATKTYHSQRSRLRTALGHLYHVALAKEHESNHMSQKLVQDNAMLSSQISSSNSLLHEKQKDGMIQKEKNVRDLTFLRKTDENLSQNSEALSGTSDGWSSTFNISNHFQDNKSLRPSLPVDTAPVEMMRSSYLPTPYSFSGSPGTTLGTIQKPDGSVSVT